MCVNICRLHEYTFSSYQIWNGRTQPDLYVASRDVSAHAFPYFITFCPRTIKSRTTKKAWNQGYNKHGVNVNALMYNVHVHVYMYLVVALSGHSFFSFLLSLSLLFLFLPSSFLFPQASTDSRNSSKPYHITWV